MKKLYICIFAFLILFLMNFNFYEKCFADLEQKEVYLTFDDGPSDRVTPKILNVLDEYGIKATFFVIGMQIYEREDLIHRIYDSGHAIGIHTFSHEYSEIYSSYDNLINDIKKCEKVLYNVLPNYSTNLYRFPGGGCKINEKYFDKIDKLYKRIEWTSLTADGENHKLSPEKLYQNAVNTSKNKNTVVLLMHDSTYNTNTVLALPKIIEYYKNSGYVFKKF